jgi:uncharacterized protein (DUF885 family)
MKITNFVLLMLVVVMAILVVKPATSLASGSTNVASSGSISSLSVSSISGVALVGNSTSGATSSSIINLSTSSISGSISDIVDSSTINSTVSFSSAEATDMRWVIENFLADFGALSRKYSVNPSEEYFDRFGDFYLSWTNRLKAIDFESLSHGAKADYILLQNRISLAQQELQRDILLFNEIKHVLPDVDSMMEFVQNRRRGEKPFASNIAQEFDRWHHQMLKLEQELANGPKLTRPQAQFASRAITSIHSGVKDAFGFYHGYDPDFTWWSEMPFSRLDGTFTRYFTFLGKHFDADALSQDASGIVGNPIGRDGILRDLASEMISYTPEQLIARAEREFAMLEQEMLKASNELGYGNDWKAALEHVKQQYVDPGRQPELVQYLAEEATEFLEERDLITIPELAKETWRMTMLSPEMQRIAPFFLGGEVVRIAYPTNTMDHASAMMSLRGNNPHFSRAVVHHELIPGHHLQQFMNQRYNTQRRAFRTPFWSEGWALYWEIVLWEKDFAESPEDRIGMLYWRMHRCARIVFSLNYHMGKMTPQQAIDYLVDKVGHERANAEAEVRRSFEGSYGPLYQISYLVGAWQIYAMREELVNTGIMTEKEFHDRILEENAIPIALLRKLLNGEELSRNFDYKWDF